MKKYLFIILFVFAIFQSVIGQVCGNDSVVSKQTRDFDDGDLTLTIEIDSFDLQNGIVYSSMASGFNSPPGSFSYSQSTFVRNMISYNSNHDTIVYAALQGNGSGYDSLKKIFFTYNPAKLPLTRKEYSFTGTVANLMKSETWTYNAGNRITSYLLSINTGNVLQKNYTYTGSQGNSLTFQKWLGGAWLNDIRYLFTYNGLIRDSLYLQRWDVPASAWIDSLNSPFDTITFHYPSYCAHLTRSEIGPGLNKVYSYYIDTISSITGISVVDNIYGSTLDTSYNYFNSHLMITDISGNYQAYNTIDQYSYNQYGRLINESSNTNSSMSSSGSGTSYDSLSNPVHSNYGTASGVHDSDHDTYYSYASASSISLTFLNDNYGALCQGDSMQTFPIAIGGCGPLHFTWSPSTWLSSDTIANPKLMLRDTISYLVTVTDSTGQYDTLTYTAFPELYESITFDTATCPGCPVNLYTSISNSTYQWYRNDTLIPGASQSFYTAVTSGSYSVRIFAQYCTFLTDPVQINIPGLTRIMGKLFLDIDSNCAFNGNDRGMYMYGPTPFLIKLVRQNYTGYIIPDSTGDFNFPIDTGTFLMSVVNPASFYNPACPDSGIISVNVPAFGDTITGINLVMKPEYNCHRLGVYVDAGFFRPCMPVDIHVNYYNEGTIDEPSPLINVTIPPELINLTSSQPHTILPNNVLSFSLPFLPIGAAASIVIHATVDCNPTDLLNATLCIDAEIIPVDFCSLQPDSTWDGSNIRLSAYCQNDSSVCFTILNDSSAAGGDMDSSSVWRLYADNILFQQGSFLLNAGQDTTLCFLSDGRTFRMEADQLPGFPQNNYPSVSIERCGILPSGNSYTLNEILQHPVNNILPFYNTYCGPVRNSFDPNEKSVQPSGAYVSVNERLKYRIDFQNTGTDTAYKVVIIDDIASALNITSLQLLSSSHPYSFHIDNRKFVWEFNPILLPDSNVNEFASHGYVEFSIMPNAALPLGTLIRNKANIFFDSNLPILTQWVNIRTCEPGLIDFVLRPISTYCPNQPYSVVADLQTNLNVNYKWYLNNSLVSSNDTLISASIQPGTNIKLLLTKNYSCSLPDTASQIRNVTYNTPTIIYASPQLIASAGISYQWYLNSSPIANAVNMTYTPSASGNYQVQVTDSNGCAVLSNVFNFIYTGINELNQEHVLYPNPADDYTFISGMPQHSEISILDLTGKVISKFINDDSFMKMYTRELLSGVYILQISSDKLNLYLQLVIQHEVK